MSLFLLRLETFGGIRDSGWRAATIRKDMVRVSGLASKAISSLYSAEFALPSHGFGKEACLEALNAGPKN